MENNKINGEFKFNINEVQENVLKCGFEDDLEIKIIYDKKDAAKIDRKTLLLTKCYELLKRQEDSEYVLNLLDEIVFYDNAECDGICLIDDIGKLLDLKEE